MALIFVGSELVLNRYVQPDMMSCLIGTEQSQSIGCGQGVFLAQKQT